MGTHEQKKYGFCDKKWTMWYEKDTIFLKQEETEQQHTNHLIRKLRNISLFSYLFFSIFSIEYGSRLLVKSIVNDCPW